MRFLQSILLVVIVIINVGIAQANFQLNSSGASHLYWPFQNSTYTSHTCSPDGGGAWSCGTGGWHVECGPNCGYHHGSDYYADDWNLTGTADCGADFLSPLSGTVIFRGWVNGYGNQVVVQANSNFAFRVTHLSNISVYNGQYVSAGTKLGDVGTTGNSSGCHAHCVLYKNISQYYGNSTALNILKQGGFLGTSGGPNTFAALYYFDATGGSTTTCSVPTSSQNYHNYITQTTARLNCTASGTYRDFQYRKSGTSTWSNVSQTSGTYRNISGLTAGTTYQWRSARKCSNGQWSNWSSTKYFTTSAATTTCSTPSSSQNYHNNVTQTTARLNCSASGTYRDFQYRKSGTSTWSNVSQTSGTYRNISGLTAGTTYQWRSARKCSNGQWSNWSSVKYFTTQANSSCNPPANPSAYNTSCSSGVFYWSAVSGASSYRLWAWNGSSWQSFATTSSTSMSLNLSTGSATYYLAVSAICGSTESNFTTYAILNTYSCKTSNTVANDPNASKPNSGSSSPLTDGGDLILPQFNVGDLLVDSPKVSQKTDLTIYPNPAINNAVIECEIAVASNVQLDLYDITGRKIMAIASGQKEAQTYTERLDLSMLDSGVYLILGKIGEQLVQEKLVISK